MASHLKSPSRLGGNMSDMSKWTPPKGPVPKVEWELVVQDHSGYLYRAKVDGGYLWRFCDPVPYKHDDGRIDWNYSWHNSITFQPEGSKQKKTHRLKLWIYGKCGMGKTTSGLLK